MIGPLNFRITISRLKEGNRQRRRCVSPAAKFLIFILSIKNKATII